jgi:nicotinamide mononucleotide transporter
MTALLALMQPWFAPAFTAWGIPFTWLEIAAVALSIAMVVCNMRVNPLGWPLAIVASLLYFALFWNSKLYGDASLQIFFVAISAWGWWQWLRGTTADGAALKVQALSRQGRIAALAAVLTGWPAIGWFLKSYTDTDVPWWDAFPTAASIVGQWMLGRKYLENWPTWVVVNVVSVGLFAYKGLWLTTALYVVFTVMALAGWRAWNRMLPASKVQ